MSRISVFLLAMWIAFFAGFMLGVRTQAEAIDAIPTVTKLDTLRLPPDPHFIETFQLDCRWIPRTE